MIEVILACTKSFGIGLGDKMPWNCPEELKVFKKKTWNNVLIIGRRTILTLPKLENRIILCLSKKACSPKARTSNNEFFVFTNILSAINYARENYVDKKIFIAGGAEVYNKVLNKDKYLKLVDRLHISIFNKEYNYDTKIKFPFLNWGIVSLEKQKDFTHYEMSYSTYSEFQYYSLLQDIYINGKAKNGRNGNVNSQFSKNMTFDLSKGFPLLTGKKMFFRGIVEELLFFLRGQTNTTILEDKGINIWKKNTDKEFLQSRQLNYEEGLMGPMYGYQFRFFNQPYNPISGEPKNNTENKNFENYNDQLKNVIELIKKDPFSRRILMTSYNPAQAEEGVLYPCHSLIIQFYVGTDRKSGKPKNLNMYCFNRSSDLFLGLPFNIASSALLLSIISTCTGLKPKFLHLSLGDVHIYSEHREKINTYLNRFPFYVFPKLKILKELSTVEDIENLIYGDFELENYNSYETISAKMIA